MKSAQMHKLEIALPEEIVIQPFGQQSADEIYNFLLPIQVGEFGIVTSRQGQPDLENILEFYQQDAGNFWVALSGKTVVGTIALKDIGNRQLALRKMFVHADHRGAEKGISKRLLGTAMRWAKDKEATDIFLGTTSKFLAAHRFYEKNGFQEITKAELPESFPVMQVDSKFYRHNLE